MITVNRCAFILFFLSIIILLAGCASSHVLVGKVRPPIFPSDVKLHLHPPAKFEEIAHIEASSKNSWTFTEQEKINKAIERLKKEAAKLGANGIILKDSATQHVGMVSSGAAADAGSPASETDVSFQLMHKVASGIAIFVIKE